MGSKLVLLEKLPKTQFLIYLEGVQALSMLSHVRPAHSCTRSHSLVVDSEFCRLIEDSKFCRFEEHLSARLCGRTHILQSMGPCVTAPEPCLPYGFDLVPLSTSGFSNKGVSSGQWYRDAIGWKLHCQLDTMALLEAKGHR